MIFTNKNLRELNTALQIKNQELTKLLATRSPAPGSCGWVKVESEKDLPLGLFVIKWYYNRDDYFVDKMNTVQAAQFIKGKKDVYYLSETPLPPKNDKI